MSSLTPGDVADAARYFGVDLAIEPFLLWIMREVRMPDIPVKHRTDASILKIREQEPVTKLDERRSGSKHTPPNLIRSHAFFDVFQSYHPLVAPPLSHLHLTPCPPPQFCATPLPPHYSAAINEVGDTGYVNDVTGKACLRGSVLMQAPWYCLPWYCLP